MTSSVTLTGFLMLWMIACAIVCGRCRKLFRFDRQATVPLRGVLVMLVVLGHLSSRTIVDFGFLRHFQWETYAVGVFMFVSGYGTMVSFLCKERYLDGYLVRIVKKLLTPVLIVMVLMVLYAWKIGQFDLVQYGRDYAAGQTALLPHSWYVFELLALSACFWLSGRINRNACMLCLLCSVLSVALFGSLKLILCWPSWWWVSTLAYPVGLWCAYGERRIRQWMSGRLGALLPLSLAGLLLGLLMADFADFDLTTVTILRQLLLGPIVLIGFYVVPLPRVGVLSFLGAISYELYLVHGIVRNSIMRHALGGWETAFGMVTIVVSIGVAYAYHELLAYGAGMFGRCRAARGNK